MEYNERVEENFSYKHAKSSWMSAIEHLALVETLAGVGEREGSIDSALQASNYQDYLAGLSDPGLHKNNFLACVPLLFAILRSIELYIKACEYVGYPKRVPTRPINLPELLDIFSRATYEKDPAVEVFIEKYTSDDLLPELVSRFLEGSDKTMNDLLRVRLQLTDLALYRVLSEYESMVYDIEEGKAFFSELKHDILPVISSAEKLQGNIDENGIPGSLVLKLIVA